jgi:hypothetical protein
MNYLEIDQDYSGTPMSLTIDTDIDGAVILARLCQFANDIDMGEGYDMTEVYSQILNQLEQFGTTITVDEDQNI